MSKTPDPVSRAMLIAAKHFGASIVDVRSQCRSSTVHAARTWGMYLASVTTDASFDEIGRRFGGRDHTVVRAVVRGRARDVAQNAQSAQLLQTMAARSP